MWFRMHIAKKLGMGPSFRIWRDAGNHVCVTLLIAAFVICVWLLVKELVFSTERNITAIAEFLLVIVLSLEGVIAALHLTQARSDAQVEALKELMRILTSKEFVDHLEKILKGIPAGRHYHDVDFQPLLWRRVTPEDAEVIYETESNGRKVKIPINREDSSLWSDIHYVANRYQEVGLLSKYNYVSRKELLRFEYLPAVRFWGRAGELITLERQRRHSPFLWYYAEWFAGQARKRNDSVSPS